MFMASAALGGVFAIGVNQLVPGAHLAPGAFALVAMGAVFGAASAATFTFIVFAFEITRDYNAVLPLMLVSVIAAAVAMRYLPNSIMTEKLARRGLHTHHEYEANVLKQTKVSEIMARGVATVAPEETVRAVADRFASGDPRMARHRALPILDRDQRLVGIVTEGDILRALEADPQGATQVLDAGTRSLVVAHPDERAFDALTKMLLNNVGRLPVVSRADAQHMVGYVNRTSLMASWGHHLEEESLRETGWLNLLRTGGKRIAAARELIGYVTDIDEVGINLRVGDSTEELALEAPVPGIRIGDYVRVSFREESGRRVVRRIEELLSRQ
jgi:CIC family chloride channel protein